jgi:hypothetical protein
VGVGVGVGSHSLACAVVQQVMCVVHPATWTALHSVAAAGSLPSTWESSRLSAKKVSTHGMSDC